MVETAEQVQVNLLNPIRWFLAEGRVYNNDNRGFDALGFQVGGFLDLKISEQEAEISDFVTDTIGIDCLVRLTAAGSELASERQEAYYFLNRKGYELIRPKMIEYINTHKPKMERGASDTYITIEMIDKIFDDFRTRIIKNSQKKIASLQKKMTKENQSLNEFLKM